MHNFDTGDDFPQLTGETLNHGTLTLPADIAEGGYSLILAYRANW